MRRHAPFEDRSEAGRALAAKLLDYRDRDDVTVLALPRGGVPVACEVSRVLSVPLDLFLVRKLGTAGHDELAMGAIATGDVRVLNADVVSALHIDQRANRRRHRTGATPARTRVPPSTCVEIRDIVDHIDCAITPEPVEALGL